MIKIQAQLFPQGSGFGRSDLCRIQIHTTPDGENHEMIARIADDSAIVEATVPKSKSAHQNVLHVLRDLLNAADIDQLGENYVPRGGV